MQDVSTGLRRPGLAPRGLPFMCAAALALLASCASLSEGECVAGDWHGIGFRDGAAGRPETHIARHAEACAGVGVQPDAVAWRAGREEGLRLYCTPENVYEAGRRGEELRDVCPWGDRAELERANERGLRYWRVGQEIAELERERSQLNRDIDRLLDGDLDEAGRARLRATRDELRRIERSLERLESERRSYARA
jgi:hypothetical protein